MSILGFWRTVSTDQLHLSFKDGCLTALTCFTAILITGFVAHTFAPDQAPLLVASMGASAVILYVLPNSPLAQPWPLVMGHLSSACIGVGVAYGMPSVIYAAATAVGLSILFMLLLKCVHPPGAATALAPILGHDPSKTFDFMFVLIPVGLNVIIMLGLAIMFNRLILHRPYPALNPPALKHFTQAPEKNRLTNAYQQDLLAALAGFESFVDVSYDDLGKLFTTVNLLGYQRNHAQITCGDVMLRHIITLDYDTDVEAAWVLMQERHLKAIPILDRAKHVIGMVTIYDFLKFVQLTPYANVQKNFWAFIRKTPALSTSKPESIGHIMTRNPTKLNASASVVEAVQLMATQRHRYIPIVDDQQHFAGMLFQGDVMAALLDRIIMQDQS